MARVRLIRPLAAFEESHAAFIEEFRRNGEELVPWVLEEQCATFAEYVAWLDDCGRGVGLPPGFVANSTFWLVDQRDEIVGVVNLRHRLTPTLRDFGGHIGFGVRPSARRRGYAGEMLRLSLLEARRLGIGDVRVTCDRDNFASARTILSNGGVLDDEAYMEEHGHVVQRYWIPA